MGDKELLNRARNDKSAKESELSFTNPVNRVAPSLFIESMEFSEVADSRTSGSVWRCVQRSVRYVDMFATGLWLNT